MICHQLGHLVVKESTLCNTFLFCQTCWLHFKNSIQTSTYRFKGKEKSLRSPVSWFPLLFLLSCRHFCWVFLGHFFVEFFADFLIEFFCRVCWRLFSRVSCRVFCLLFWRLFCRLFCRFLSTFAELDLCSRARDHVDATVKIDFTENLYWSKI